MQLSLREGSTVPRSIRDRLSDPARIRPGSGSGIAIDPHAVCQLFAFGSDGLFRTNRESLDSSGVTNAASSRYR